jgi:threonine/homoserine/homoserine lactone efflux protein
MFLFFAKGLAAGALIALPAGPIGIICLRRMLAQGPLVGIASGFGSATADIIYSTIAIVGLSMVSSFLMHHFILFRVISSIFLCTLGIKIIFSKPPRPRATWTGGIAEAYLSTFFLTLTNPLLILSFAALFALFNIRYEMTTIYSLFVLISGVFIGSSLWWFVLGGLTSFMKLKINPQTIQKINVISGILIILSGLITLLTILFK